MSFRRRASVFVAPPGVESTTPAVTVSPNMHATSPTRKPSLLALCLAITLAIAASVSAHASGPRQYRRPAPPRLYVQYPQQYPPPRVIVPGRPYPGQPRVIIPGPPPGYYGAPPAPVVRNPRGDHLAEWMDKHRNLSPAQQQQALAAEPGFRQLPPQTQQREMQRLAQLNSMPPQQRERMLSRNEYIERMNPQQREQFRGTMQQLGSLPPDQRRVVARSFHQLRQLPPNQRMAAASRIPLDGAQRNTLYNLLRIEPLLPPDPVR